MTLRAGPWVRSGSLGRDKTGQVPNLLSIDGKKPVALEHRHPNLVRVLFERPDDGREPIAMSVGAMPAYVWDGAP